MRVAVGLVLCMFLASIPIASAQSESTDEEEWPGDPLDSHIHLTWATVDTRCQRLGRRIP
jgi:hypothetical protein